MVVLTQPGRHSPPAVLCSLPGAGAAFVILEYINHQQIFLVYHRKTSQCPPGVGYTVQDQHEGNRSKDKQFLQVVFHYGEKGILDGSFKPSTTWIIMEKLKLGKSLQPFSSAAQHKKFTSTRRKPGGPCSAKGG